MTDPPALAFAGALNNSETPSLSYAPVYPLTMLRRVISAQPYRVAIAVAVKPHTSLVEYS
jgi:uncharacterized transporter YbjL